MPDPTLIPCTPDQDALRIYPRWKALSPTEKKNLKSGSLTSAFLDEWEAAYDHAFRWAWGESFLFIKEGNHAAAKIYSKAAPESGLYETYCKHLESLGKKAKSQIDLLKLTPEHIVVSAIRDGASAVLAGQTPQKRNRSTPFRLSIYNGRKDFFDGPRKHIKITGFGALALRREIPGMIEVQDVVAERTNKQWRLYIVHKKVPQEEPSLTGILRTKITNSPEFIETLPMAEELFEYAYSTTQRIFFDLKKVGFKVNGVQRQVAHTPGFVREEMEKDAYFYALSKSLPISTSADAMQQALVAAKSGKTDMPSGEDRLICMAKARNRVHRPTHYITLPKFGNIAMEDPILPTMDIQSAYVFKKEGGWWFHINYIEMPED